MNEAPNCNTNAADLSARAMRPNAIRLLIVPLGFISALRA
jgi:hypothetical protein